MSKGSGRDPRPARADQEVCSQITPASVEGQALLLVTKPVSHSLTLAPSNGSGEAGNGVSQLSVRGSQLENSGEVAGEGAVGVQAHLQWRASAPPPFQVKPIKSLQS